MSIPDYQTIMLPLLQYAEQRKFYPISDAVAVLGKTFQLTVEELEERLPGRNHRLFANRVSWAHMCLKQAGLLETVGRATYQLTQRGKQVLDQNPGRVDKRLLRQFAEFTEFQAPRDKDSLLEVELAGVELDPLEAFHQNYLTIRQNLADELLEMLKRTSPTFFEKLVMDLLVKMGYGGSDTEIRQAAMKGNQDKGIDGVIKEDVLGLSHIYLQAKRWKDSVGSQVVHGFSGSMDQFHATKGVLITTSTFTEEARRFIGKIGKTIILIDGQQLVQLMLEHELGVKTIDTYKIQAIDTAYYELEEPATPEATG